MEFEGMPSCWTDYYVQGFKYVNEVMGRPAGESQINAAADILKSYNPRINYREEELTPEFIFQRCTETWDCRLDAGKTVLQRTRIKRKNISGYGTGSHSVKKSGIQDSSTDRSSNGNA